MRYYFLILFITLYTFSFSQIQRCSTDEYREVLKSKGLYNYSKKEIPSNQLYAESYSIPVVVHILYNSDEQNISDDRVYSQIETLNNDYNALNVEIASIPLEFQDVVGAVGFSFCLVQEDLEGNVFSGINRVYTDVDVFQAFSDEMKQSNAGGVDAWDSENYLNIWVCNLSGNTLGFATMPGDVDPELDGVVIDYEYFGVDLSFDNPYNLGRTGTHEVGHYFNLEHTFFAGCSDLDNCDDTPAIAQPTYGCPDVPQESCSSIDMTMNYMDYTNDACMFMFTVCQAELMIESLLTYRPNLISDSNCSVSLKDVISFDEFLIYPNPTQSSIHINLDNTLVSIFDLYGREILVDYFVNTSNIDLSFLRSGTYVLSIGANTYKFIKE